MQPAKLVIVVHNHPSRSTEPSNTDKKVTEVLDKERKLLDIPILDHVVIGSDGVYFSFRDGLLMGD